MPYKKYIKIGDKIYGPYIYHSKRVNGKVVTEYHGQQKTNYKIIFFITSLLIIASIVFFIFNKDGGTTGKTILDLTANYEEGKPLDGKLRIGLQQGELIPTTTKIYFENNGNILEYYLKDLISDEKTYEGNFYVVGSSLSGSGSGFGIPGEKKVYPKVYFTLNLLSEIQQTEETRKTTQETSQIQGSQQESSQELEQSEIKSEEVGESPITGNVISRFFKITGNFLGVTGNVVAEFEREIQGQVSVGEVFKYNLQEGERAELKPRSVRTDSKNLQDTEIKIEQHGEEIIVTTEYFENEEGFGSEYFGDGKKQLEIDISKLNLVLQPGTLKIGLKYNGLEIISFLTELREGKLNANKTIQTQEIQSEENLTENQEKENLGNITVPITTTNITSTPVIEEVRLSEQEKEILYKEFGNVTVQIKEAKERNNFLVVKYELGIYWIEYSYNLDLDKETLKKYMEQDRIKWLKDIAKRLSEKEQPEKEATGLVGSNFSF